MGIGSSLSNALTTVKKKTDTYNKNRNYATDIDRTNKWSQQLEDTYNQINNMGKFSYDMNNDAFYQQYAQRYADNAKLAMQDTVGQISALTGGYGNSYAATAGQAMYNQQMEGLNDRATELYQLALQQYNAESDRLNNLYSITANAYGMEQDRINAEIAEAQWNADFEERQRQYNLGLMMDAAGMAIDVGKFGANMAFDVSRAAVSDYQWGKSFDYKAERDKVSDQQFADQLALEYDALSREYGYKYAALEQDKNQHSAEMEYKYAALNDEIKKAKSENISIDVAREIAVLRNSMNTHNWIGAPYSEADITGAMVDEIEAAYLEGTYTTEEVEALLDYLGVEY